MKLNENDEKKTISNISFNYKKVAIQKRALPKLLELKRKRNINDTIEYNNIIKSYENDIISTIKVNEEIDFFNLSTSGRSSSINKNESKFINNYDNYNCEEKIMQLKFDLQDKPYFQFQNYY